MRVVSIHKTGSKQILWAMLFQPETSQLFIYEFCMLLHVV